MADHLSSLRASLALLGAFCALFCSVGFVNAFGVFQEYYKANQLHEKSEFDISWLGSFSSFVLFAGAVPAGILVDKIGPLLPMTAGSICLLLGIFMTSLCNEYWQFFLAQALLLGLGFSFVLTPAVATIPRYWKKNRALAMGITIAGSSTGGVIWPIALNNLLNHTSIGFGWTLRIIGFVMVPLLSASCLTVRPPLLAPKDSTSIEKMAEAGAQSAATPEKSDAKTGSQLIKNPTFLILCAGLGTLYLGFFGPFFYVSSYSVNLGQSSSFSFYLISILNSASFVGRVLPGFLADRYGPWNLLIISASLSALVGFCWTAATSVAGVVVWSLAYGFASGVSTSAFYRAILMLTCVLGDHEFAKYLRRFACEDGRPR